MKKITKTFFSLMVLFAFAACSTGEKKLIYSLEEPNLKVEVWQFERSIIEEQLVVQSDINIEAKGSLAYVLTNIHNPSDADLDISILEDKNRGIELKLETPQAPAVKQKINEIIVKFTRA